MESVIEFVTWASKGLLLALSFTLASFITAVILTVMYGLMVVTVRKVSKALGLTDDTEEEKEESEE